MKKYDIGILTFWKVPNYGTYAQAYALQKVLEYINPTRDVKQIAHLDKKHYNFYFDLKSYYRSYPVWKRAFWKSFSVKNDVLNERKKHKFFVAYEKIPHTDPLDLNNSDEYSFDSIFLGSDIVWDYSLEPFNHDPMLFGNGFKATQINSYAASFGTIKPDMKIPEYVSSSIKKMKNISVRDENSADIVEQITGKRPTVVLDPAWIWNFDTDINIKAPKEENYLLIYGQDFTEGFIENLIKYAKEHNLKTIALDCNSDSYNWCDKLIKQDELDPLEWIGYFKSAEAVATSTFHGITFGLIFNKRIAFCKTDFIIAKIGTLLKKLKIYDVFNNSDDVYSMLDYEWDYSYINEYMNKERNKSIDYLKKACIK